MKKRYITASQIWPMTGSLPEHAVLVFDGFQLIDIVNQDTIDPSLVEQYNGTLIPGFVNAHCHLELSYTKGKIDSGTGLTTFLREVVTQDPVSDELILDAIIQADQEMKENGIVAVGDISNRSITASTKANSPIAYYTFVEMFDFLSPDRADTFYEQYESVYQAFRSQGLEHVVQVPHSPYTVSDRLMDKLAGTVDADTTGSIHMLENEQEGYLLGGGQSEYPAFFELLGFGMDHYRPPNRTSMEQFLESGYQPDRMLFVHNTVAKKEDLMRMVQYDERNEAYLVTCPNANRYIESRLPDYDLWIDSALPVCIGTDSYASNHQLSIWHEICTIQELNPHVHWEELIKWGTLNGAAALGMENKLGSFEPGKFPGVVLLEHRPDETINQHARLRRIL